MPEGTETFFACWDSKTDFPIQTQGYWECKIYKPFEDIAYARIELSLFTNGADHYKWFGSASDTTIVWEQIVTNSDMEKLANKTMDYSSPTHLSFDSNRLAHFIAPCNGVLFYGNNSAENDGVVEVIFCTDSGFATTFGNIKCLSSDASFANGRIEVNKGEFIKIAGNKGTEFAKFYPYK